MKDRQVGGAREALAAGEETGEQRRRSERLKESGEAYHHEEEQYGALHSFDAEPSEKKYSALYAYPATDRDRQRHHGGHEA